MFGATRAPTLRVLLYHRIEDPAAPRPDLAPDLVEATPARLEQHLRHLARFYHPIGADELLASFEGRHVLPSRAVLVTFDDGYRDFLEIAWPMLKQFRIPAIFFVPTAFMDNPDRVFWWDATWQLLARTPRDRLALPGAPRLPLRTRAERRAARGALDRWLKTLTPAGREAALQALAEHLGVRPEPTRAVVSWPELRQLAGDGVTVAAHSRTHELLDRVDGPTLEHEVAGSRDDLVRELGSCPPLFAYPYGFFNRETVAAADAAGFRVGFSVAHGLNQLDDADPRLLRRDQGSVSLPRFALHLLGPLARLRVTRNPLPAYPRPYPGPGAAAGRR